MMKPKVPPPKRRSLKRSNYEKLGRLLRAARTQLRDKTTGKCPTVFEMATHLRITPSFVYQVEEGRRKPKDRSIGQWASVYGVAPEKLWKCLHKIPMNLVASFKAKPEPIPVDPFSQLMEEEKSELLPFLDFVRWKIGQQVKRDER